MANGELPEGWDLARIRDKFTFTTKPRDLRLNNYKKVAVLPMEAIPTGHLYVREFQEKPPSQISSGTYFEEGDLLLSKITPCFENGKQAIAAETPNGFGIATTEVIPIKPIPCVSQTPFLAYYLLDSEVRAALAGKMEGATGRQRLSKSLLEESEIAFPPLPEQQAIAGVLSKLQGAVEAQDKIIATLKELKAATLARLFREGLRGEPLKETEIGEIPESWEIVRLGDVAKVGNGSTPSRETPTYWRDGTIPWITSTKVHDLYIKTADEFVTEQAFKKCHLPLVSRGSVVVAITGQGKTLGHAAMVELDTCINQHLAYLTVKNGAMSSEFVLAYLQTCYDDLRQAGSSGGTTKGALTCGFLSQYLIPKPSFEEQVQIGNTFRRLHERIQGEERIKNRYQSLFQSMLHLLMTGEVRVTPLMNGALS